MKRHSLTKSKAKTACGGMKRNVLFVLLALTALSATYAQDNGGRKGQPRTPPPAGQTLSVTGNLELLRGTPALVDGGTTYYAPDLLRYAGFIEGLKEGAKVTVEGQAFAQPQDSTSKMIRVSKLTIGSKSYDLAAAAPRPDTSKHPRGGPARRK